MNRRAVSVLCSLLLIAGPVVASCDPAEPADDGDDAFEAHDDDAELSTVESTPYNFADTVEEARPAVVNIYTQTAPEDVDDSAPVAPPGMVPEDRIRESLGSGFIFDESGLVLTNEHVVGNATEIAVRLLDERVFSAQIVGSDPPTDVAVLQLLEVDEDLPVIALGDSDELRVGNWVLAIGNPFGLTSTVTAGIASATGRQLMPRGARLRFQDFIQTDASINPGSSGGPLINLDAEAVGIATFFAAAGQGLGFAIPINMVQEILPDLLEYGRVQRSWLGIYIGHVPESLPDELEALDHGEGALLTRLVEDGPAAEAGLEAGDVIVELDGHHIDDAHHIAWLASTIGVGKTVDIVVVRGEDRLTIPITMGLLPDD